MCWAKDGESFCATGLVAWNKHHNCFVRWPHSQGSDDHAALEVTRLDEYGLDSLTIHFADSRCPVVVQNHVISPNPNILPTAWTVNPVG